jgi:hypothetical protein
MCHKGEKITLTGENIIEVDINSTPLAQCFLTSEPTLKDDIADSSPVSTNLKFFGLPKASSDAKHLIQMEIVFRDHAEELADPLAIDGDSES